MPILSSGTTYPLTIPAGNALVTIDLSGTSTVTGVTREDASRWHGAGAKACNPVSTATAITISTTGKVDYRLVAGDATPSSESFKYNPVTFDSTPSDVAAVAAAMGVFVPVTANARGIRDALLAALAVRGRVELDSMTTYDLTDGGTNSTPLPIYNNMSVTCPVMPSFQWGTTGFQSPDSTPELVRGARLVGDGTFDAFAVNADAVAPFPSPGAFSNAGVSGVRFENLVFDNVKTGIRAGGTNNPGLWFSKLRQIIVIRSTDWGISLENFQHIDVSHVYTQQCFHGQRYSCSSGTSVLSPGNSEFDHLFNNRGDNIKSRGIVFEAYGSTAELNECNIDYIQANSPSNTIAPVTATMSSASADISVPNASLFSLDLPVYFTVQNTNGFNKQKLGQTYFIVDVNTAANTIRVADTMGGAALVPTNATSNSTQQIGSLGFPGIEIVGRDGGLVLHWTMANIDQESGGTTGFYLQNARSGKCSLRNVVGPGGGKTKSVIASRGASFILESSYEGVVLDADVASSVAWLGARAATPIQNNPGFGVVRDDTTGQVGLSILEYQGQDIYASRPTSFGGDTLFFKTAIQWKVAQRGTGGTEGAGSGTYYTLDVSGGTRGLPTINNDNQLGVLFSLTNPWPASGSYTSAAANTFNNKPSATTLTIPAYGSVTVQAQKVGSTYFWAVIVQNGATF